MLSRGPQTHGVQMLVSNFPGRRKGHGITGMKQTVFELLCFRCGPTAHGRKIIVFNCSCHKKRPPLAPQVEAPLVPQAEPRLLP